jgi:ribosomal protein S18 acetylase RimI-like enzyme
MLEWDSTFLRFPTAVLVAHDETDDQLGIALQSARERGFTLVYWKPDHSRSASHEMVKQYGGQLVCNQVTYSRGLLPSTDEIPSGRSPEVVIREYPSDFADASLIHTAIQASRFSRFRLDRRFAPGTCDRLYREWISKCVSHELADHVFVVGSPGAWEGLISIRINGSCGTIGLLAVDEQGRGRGLGTALIHHTAQILSARNLGRMDVVTQLENDRAVQFYSRIGFRVERLQRCYHFWL